MEFIARTVTHPNPKLDKVSAVKSLKKHPQFKPGTVIVGLRQEKSHWVADLHEPKVAAKSRKKAGPPPFLDDAIKGESVPTDEVIPDEEIMEGEGASEEEPDSEGDKEKDGGEASIEAVMDLVKQIAEAVGVSPDGEKGDKPSLDDMPEPMDDPLPPMDAPPPKGPKGGPPPGGPTPIGSPAFASTKAAKPKVASFDVQEPWDGTIRQAKEAIESQYGEHGYKVKKIREDVVDGQRVVRARVSVR